LPRPATPSPPPGGSGRLRPEREPIPLETLPELTRQLLSVPREAGTPDAAKARELIADHLRRLGYKIEIQRFFFSPASLRAFPLFGAGLGGLAVILLPLLYSHQAPPWAALALWAAGLAALLVLVSGVGLGWVALGESAREDANLVATRGGDRPRRWIVAHLDSKAQGHSMAGRLIAVWVTVLATAALSVLALARLNAPVGAVWLVAGAALALAAGFLAGKGQLRGRSPGARDNGSGIVAVLTAAEASSDPGLGILITGAEEFGLVGARVFAHLLSPGLQDMEFVNVDTVDEEGTLSLVSHNTRGQQLAGKLEPALARLGMPIRSRRLPIGIFVDSVPLARVAPAITIGRLTWRTLQRIHTPADTADGLSLETARRLGKALASN
jgi:Peptidase family M28